jgi:MFS family permease
MTPQVTLTRATLRTPKAAAIAGIVFSVLLTTALVLLRSAVPSDPMEGGVWLSTNARVVSLALNLIPFAGIAFLWFIGVLRDRLGPHEDRFFATVFLGSGFLFLAMLFVAAGVAGAMLVVFAYRPEELIGTVTLHLGRAVAQIIMNIYTVKMAGVFMVTTSTLALYTGFAPRWIAVLGYGLALLLLLGSSYIAGILIVLPVWVFLVSVYILVDNLRRPSQAVASPES